MPEHGHFGRTLWLSVCVGQCSWPSMDSVQLRSDRRMLCAFCGSESIVKDMRSLWRCGTRYLNSYFGTRTWGTCTVVPAKLRELILSFTILSYLADRILATTLYRYELTRHTSAVSSPSVLMLVIYEAADICFAYFCFWSLEHPGGCVFRKMHLHMLRSCFWALRQLVIRRC